ncbi:Membrane-bound lytic murein transglycosylase D precursor [Labrenzia sp. THAF191b]|nr:Membrane-bound lytic murein transglycosylase D precursor [Labrenzia sp. THAF191b]QFT07096.1 Membrane-bound lytic murein transglycosylase D precursor [Labrenzia sp. THAF191a]QFT18640.1 Membrane-bound lytic murein transglycosylase D precursor [Labrenzia sp. THAF187b]
MTCAFHPIDGPALTKALRHFLLLAIAGTACLSGFGSSYAAEPAETVIMAPVLAARAAAETVRKEHGPFYTVRDEAAFLQQMCSTIEAAANKQGLPPGFFAKLIWKESRFDPNAISPAGAEGIAQFMPYTAANWGLENSFEPVEAIEASSRLLGYLLKGYGNLGLAAAAYNAGEDRVDNWRRGRGRLPDETRNYVYSITGYKASDWKQGKGPDVDFTLDQTQDFQTACQDFRLIEAPLQRRLANTYYNRGLALAKSKDYSAALLRYTVAIRLRPEFPEAYNNRGLVYRMMGDYGAAIANYDVALKMRPGYAAAYNNRGYAKRKLDQYREAIADYDKALAINTNYAAARFNRGFAQAQLEDYAAAIADYDVVLKLVANHPLALYNRGKAHLAAGHLNKAEDDFNSAIAHSDGFAKAYYSRANLRLQLGQRDQAKEDYLKSVSLDAGLGRGKYAIAFD